MSPDALFAHVPLFILVLTRLTGLFVFAPLLSSPVIPPRVRVLLAVAFAAAVAPAVTMVRPMPEKLDVHDLPGLMAGELLIGVSIGVVAAIPLITAQLAGIIMGQQMGLGLASVYNPAVDFEGDTLGQILFFVALASYLVAGGLELVFETLISTFAAVPVGGFRAADAPLDLLTGVITSGFAVALRMALPVLVILLLESVAVGFIMKTVPSLNIMNIGFPIRILLGLLMVVASIVIMLEVLMEEIGLDLQRLRDWAAALG
jgi:flagellar biosynthetic protein FliR